ncbi:MAG: (Fe-S)-binding protein [Alphaproteobacteria bacterium]|nr:(Fe-S)-binding protein [Alphaproteobacteria bacterium]
MQDRIQSFIASLDSRVSAIAEACTACGACARVCPTLDVAGIDGGDPVGLTAGVRDILNGDDAPAASRAWAQSCCSSGRCLSVCEEGINPRFMLTMARRALSQDVEHKERQTAGKKAFQKMSRGVRVISRLTLPPALLARLSPPAPSDHDGSPEFVFYTGCNMLKTPHIGLLCLEVLDALGVTYDVQGGPGACCGILQARPGDTENAGRQAFTTLDKFAESGTSRILSWCPTCQIQFGETMIPEYRQAGGVSLEMSMFPVYLASRLDDLRRQMTRPVPKRVAIYEYAGELGVMAAVRALLGAIPGLEIVEIETSSIGYNNASLAPLGSYHRQNMNAALDDAEAAEVDTFVGIYHADHREFSGHERERPFKVANYMELIGESMGIAVEDRFKQLKLMQDADAIVASSMEQILAYSLDPAVVREVVIADLLGE